jgi:O-acetyl-ADP-ribose deacetylase (regulator of RNase III)
LLAECRTLKGIPTGVAKITKGHNLPASYIIHATGPIASINPKTGKKYEDYAMLAKTYISCLTLAAAKGIKEIAFCCISTGMFGFDKEKSSQVAFDTVKNWVKSNPKCISRIIFNVFTQEDYDLYTKLVLYK